jgi:hypothetical protein
VINVAGKWCWKVGGGQDGEWSAFTGDHELMFTKITVLTHCHVISGTWGHFVWFGLGWFSGGLETGGGWGDPIIVHCNGENGSGDLPHHVYVADTGET